MRRIIAALLLTALALAPLAAQPKVSEQQEVAIFAMGYYGWNIPREALGSIDLEIQKVFLDLGRFTVMGYTQRFTSTDVQSFVDILKKAKETNFVLPEKYQFGEAFLTEADFNRLVGSFIIAVPVVTSYNSQYVDNKEWRTDIKTNVSFINVADGTMMGIANVETQGTSRETQYKSVQEAIDGIPVVGIEGDFRVIEQPFPGVVNIPHHDRSALGNGSDRMGGGEGDGMFVTLEQRAGFTCGKDVHGIRIGQLPLEQLDHARCFVPFAVLLTFPDAEGKGQGGGQDPQDKRGNEGGQDQFQESEARLTVDFILSVASVAENGSFPRVMSHGAPEFHAASLKLRPGNDDAEFQHLPLAGQKDTIELVHAIAAALLPLGHSDHRNVYGRSVLQGAQVQVAFGCLSRIGENGLGHGFQDGLNPASFLQPLFVLQRDRNESHDSAGNDGPHDQCHHDFQECEPLGSALEKRREAHGLP